MKRNKRGAAPRLILASASPRRRLLMRKHGYTFVIRPSHVSENESKRRPPAALVKELALKKAKAVAKSHPKDVVLGADTIVHIHGRVIGKPRNHKDAERILRRLSGAWQRVYTGVAVVWNGGKESAAAHAVSHVKCRKLTDKDIMRASRAHLDKAGAYSVQERNDPFVERVRGDFDNVVGLPMRVVKRLLRRSRRVHHFLKTV